MHKSLIGKLIISPLELCIQNFNVISLMLFVKIKNKPDQLAQMNDQV